MDVVYNKPNEETKEAIEEAKAGKFAGTIDTSNMEGFLKSCSEWKQYKKDFKKYRNKPQKLEKLLNVFRMLENEVELPAAG